MGALQILLVEQPRGPAAKERWTDLSADQITDLVPEGCRREEDCEQDRERREMPLRAQQPGGKEQGIAGQNEAHDDAGLGEDDQTDTDQTERMDE